MSFLPEPTQEIQRSDEWQRKRQRRLGGSEIASVLQISPYKTRLELWEEKVGILVPRDISNLPHVKRGIDAEPIICEKVEQLLNVKYTQPVLIHPTYPQFVSSLDGKCDDHLAEFKTMSAVKHKEVASGVIPEYYRAQMQWALMIENAIRSENGVPHVKRCLFASYRPEDGSLHMTWEYADKTWQETMLDKAIEFWSWVVAKVRPPEIELDL